jgi:hypothetical protein
MAPRQDLTRAPLPPRPQRLTSVCRAVLVTALVAAVVAAGGGGGGASASAGKRQRFAELSEKAGDSIALGDLAGAEKLLEEALALKPSSAKTANDLGVVLLQWVAEADVGHSSVGLVRGRCAMARGRAVDDRLWRTHCNSRQQLCVTCPLTAI